MTVIWLAITVLLSLLAANLWSDLREVEHLLVRQRQLICRQSAVMDDQSVLIKRLREQLSHQRTREARTGSPLGPAIPTMLGPSGPITLN